MEIQRNMLRIRDQLDVGGVCDFSFVPNNEMILEINGNMLRIRDSWFSEGFV